MLWSPESEKQWLALLNPADELFYGGAAGGGKSDLLLGLATECHQRSAIFRRVYTNLKELIRRTREIVGQGGVENKTDRTFEINDGTLIEFGAVQFEDDKRNWQGRPHDLKGFDEITEFTESQYLFITGWNRSSDPNQRVRVVVTGNPPSDDVGTWVLRRWAPWLDPKHPNPAKPGELRWYATVNGEEREFSDGEMRIVDDEQVYPKSRTFIPASLADNPYYAHSSQYISTLQSLPEPLRSQLLYGDFGASITEDPWQAIPTRWVRLAQQRWIDSGGPPDGDKSIVDGVGCDPSRGGSDFTAISKRYGIWFDEVQKVHARVAKDGPEVADRVVRALEGKGVGYINVDVIGIGASVFDSLAPSYKGRVRPVNVSEASRFRDKSGKMKMRNMRAEMYWKMREALDPEHGDDLMLPPGQEVVADLCAARYTVSTAGILIESKDDIKKRLGRSPDVGEALMLAHLHPEMVGTQDNPFYD